MNIFDMMKQLKSIQDSVSSFRESLKKETITYEDENVKIVANAAGEVLEIKIKTDNCKGLEEKLLKAFKKLNEETKKRVKQLAQNSIFGGMGLF
jgi:DNA-binding protein YbaB